MSRAGKATSSAGVDVSRLTVIAPNLKRRLSGVTSTIVQLVPLQTTLTNIAVVGWGLPAHLPRLAWSQAWRLLTRPATGRFRVWHARRNTEMLAGIVLRDILRAPLRLLFTSASQREHTGWTRFLIRRMDAVVATSTRTASYLRVPNTVVMHGIDTERFSPPAERAQAARELGLDDGQLHVGCFGRVRRQKGTDLFVDVMIALLPHHPRWSAVIAGRATAQHKAFEDELKQRVVRAGLADRILFVGEHRDIERWYRALSLFVAPQRWEGFGLTPLEAMASGVPVVATDVGAFSELIEDGRTGRVVPPDDPAAMQAAVGDYLADPVLVAGHGDNARALVMERFQLIGEARKLVDIYETLSQGMEADDHAG